MYVFITVRGVHVCFCFSAFLLHLSRYVSLNLGGFCFQKIYNQ